FSISLVTAGCVCYVSSMKHPLRFNRRSLLMLLALFGPTLLIAAVASAASSVSITSITPNKGPTASGIAVVIKGTGFPEVGDCDGPIIDVMFDDLSAFPNVPPTATEVKVFPPKHAPGPVDVKVTNLCTGSSGTVLGGYTYLGAGILNGSIPKGGG